MKRVKEALGRAFLAATGWQQDGDRPSPPQFVLIAAPHTTNWDLPFMLALSFVYDVPIKWAGKHTLFEPPYGVLMRALGGIPIVRHERGNRVQALAALFDEIPDLVLTMPAEGTRSRTEYWKSGFYRIAVEADVPIVCGFLDYSRKRGGFGLVVHPTGDVRADMAKIRRFYEDKVGMYPEKFGPVRLRAEDESEEEVAA